MEANTQKDEETCVTHMKIHLGTSSMIHAPQAWTMLPKCERKIDLDAPSVAKIHSGTQPCAPTVGRVGHNCFSLLLRGKSLIVKPNFRWKLSF